MRRGYWLKGLGAIVIGVSLLLAALGLRPSNVSGASANNESESRARKESTIPAPLPTRSIALAATRIAGLPRPPTRTIITRVETKRWTDWGAETVRADVVDIRLSRFPRPASDNGRGLHWFPTTGQKPQVIDRFVPELRAMHIHWLVILQGTEEWDLDANDYLVEQLLSERIVPVMRIEARVGALDLGRLNRVVEHYRAKGARYFQLFNEPNVPEEWSTQGPRTPEEFIRYWIPAAEVVARNGGLPGLAPLSPNQADELFLDSALHVLLKQGRYDLINIMWLAIHNYGGMDEAGFLRYQRYARVVKNALGQNLPMLATEGGMGDALTSGDTVVAAFEHMQAREPWMLAYCPWLIGNMAGGGHDETWEAAGWFQANGPLPIVERIKALP